MTNVARDILQLLSDLQTQRQGRGITLLALTEIYRGSKAKTHTKFLNTSSLKGYGAGKGYNKGELDSIVHAMVFESIIEELSEGVANGFSADYVHPGPKAQSLQNGNHQFYVNFPKAPEKMESKKKSSKKKEAQDDETEQKKKAATTKQKKKKSKKGEPLQESPGSTESFKRSNESTLLPKKFTDELLSRIKKLVSMWAEEVRQHILLFPLLPILFQQCTHVKLYFNIPFYQIGTNER